MLPYLDFGPFHVNLYVFFNALAALAGAAALFLRWTGGGVPPRTARLAIVGGLAGAIAGAFLAGWVMVVLGAAKPHGNIPLVASELGLLLGGGAAVMAILLRATVAIWPAVDRAVVAVTLAQAISRTGCIAAGCCFGRPASGPLALPLPDVSGAVCPRYPTQLAMVVFHLAMVPLLLAAERRWASRPGVTASLYVLTFALVRIVLEPFRGDVWPLMWGLTGTQLLSILVALAAGATLVAAYRTADR